MTSVKTAGSEAGRRGRSLIVSLVFALVLAGALFSAKAEASTPARRIILVGDSRTEGMHQFIGEKKNVIWSYKSSMGLTWMRSTGVPRIESQIRSNTAVVILMGVNDVLDLWQADNYASYLNERAAVWKKKGAETFYVSLTPVDDKKDKYEKNADLIAWNTRIKKKLGSNVTYVDIFNKMKTGLETTSDGLHYQKASCIKFFNLVYDAVKTSHYDPSTDETCEEYYKVVYDFDSYMKFNSDLKVIYKNDPEGAFQHFLKHGMKHGRRAKSTFDPISYMLRYKYLRKKYKTDWKEYYLHYIRSGYKYNFKGSGCGKMLKYDTVYKDIDYSHVYDYNYYVKKRANVFRRFGYDEAAVLKYYVTVDMPKGMRANDEFSWSIYRNYNPDLKKKFGTNKAQYFIHYTTVGYKQNRRHN